MKALIFRVNSNCPREPTEQKSRSYFAEPTGKIQFGLSSSSATLPRLNFFTKCCGLSLLGLTSTEAPFFSVARHTPLTVFYKMLPTFTTEVSIFSVLRQQ